MNVSDHTEYVIQLHISLSLKAISSHRHMSHIVLLFLFLGFFNIHTAFGNNVSPYPKAIPDIHLQNILRDIATLSHPKFEGRQAGTTGGLTSARFIAKRFKALGLLPVAQEANQQSDQVWFQQNPLTTTQILAPAFVRLFTTKGKAASTGLQVGKDYIPVLDSPSVNLTAPVVFVGYGINDPARGIDNYQDVHVHNRIVLFLRGKPPTYSRWITHKEKVHIAQKKGAAGFLTVTGPRLNRYEARKGLGQMPLAIYSTTPDNRPIPGAWISGEMLDHYLAPFHKSLQSLQQQAHENPGNVSRPLPLLGHLSWNTRQEHGKLINVLGMVQGKDPILRDEIIVIGAHRDHFGKQAGLTFLGADDNASGTAVMLEVARHFTKEGNRPQRSMLFVSFDGEERGLLGSRLYVSHPGLPLDQTVAMINLDHVGVGNGTLTVGITRLEKSIAQQAAAHAELAEKIQLYGYFPGGDHVPFYESKVPTITVVSAGIHSHFHQASDMADTIKSGVVLTATQFVLNLLDILANPS